MVEPHRPLRICFVSLRAYPLFNPECKEVFGGAEVDLYLLAVELAKDPDYEISFIVGDFGQLDGKCREGVKLYKSINVDKNMILQGRRLWSALKRADADIIMSESCSLNSFLQALFCQRFDRRFILRTSSSQECDGTYLCRHRLRAPFVTWAFQRAKPLITQNLSDAADLKRTLGLDSLVIANGTRLPQLEGSPRDVILWVARSAPSKQPEVFIEMARTVPEESFLMICPRAVEDKNYNELKRKADSVANLTFIEGVSYHQIGAYFQRAKAFVCTSLSEGFPNTYIQACQYSAPILTLQVNPDNFLNRYRCGLCAEGDCEKMPELLRQLISPETRAEMGVNARRYAEECHDINKIIQRYKTLFTASQEI